MLRASCPFGLLRPVSSLLQDEQLTEYSLNGSLEQQKKSVGFPLPSKS